MCEKKFIDGLRNVSGIIIYGAGMVGKLVYMRLVSNGLKDNIIGFAVSHKTKEKYLEAPVYGIYELFPYKESATVVIATLPALHGVILDTLHSYGFCNVWKITEALYEEMSMKHVEEFRKEHPFEKGDIDVLLMASDNNSSSGAFLCLADLSVELKKRDISNVVVLPEYGNGEEILISKNINYLYIPSKHWARKAEDFSTVKLDEQNADAVKEIAGFIARHHVRLVHNNTTYTYVGAVAAERNKVPYIWHIRENILEQGYCFLDTSRSIKMINESEKIIVVSKFMKSCYRDLDDSKVRIVYDGIDTDYYWAKRELFTEKRIRILLVGVITPLKGQKELIEAAYELKRRRLDFMIQFVGSGDEDYLNELHLLTKEYRLENHIMFCGRRDNVNEFYQNADIVAVCSRAESFGRTTVEAQLSGCLIIGANAGATPELIEDGRTGYLYEHGDSKELAEKIIYAASTPDISKGIAWNGQRRACNTYSKEHNAEEIVKIYEEILEQRKE